MKIQTVKSFEMIKDMLVYIATATHEVNFSDIQENVVDLCRSQVISYLNTLTKEGYLIKHGNYRTTYTATLKTKQLFGIAP